MYECEGSTSERIETEDKVKRDGWSSVWDELNLVGREVEIP